MRSKTGILNLRHYKMIPAEALLMGALLVLLILSVATVGALATSGQEPVPAAEPEPIRVVESEKTEDSESVTLAIPVADGAAIDFETSKNVRIDSWDGDEVLVIVERVVKPGRAPQTRKDEPMDIQITRRGKDIHIRAMNEWGIEGVDVVFRVVVPKSLTATSSITKTSYDLSKLTSVVLGALHKEAVRWAIR